MPHEVSQNHKASVSFDANDFHWDGIIYDAYAISIVYDVSDFVSSSLEVLSYEINGSVEFFQKEVILDSNTNQIIFNGWTHEVGDGSVTFSFSGVYKEDKSPFYKRFNVSCADMPLTAPTMRQLLTTLMQQVGCIPTVENRVLGFLDFQVEPTKFGGEKGYNVNHTINYVQKSCSGDSAANNLVKISENVLKIRMNIILFNIGIFVYFI